MGLQDEYNLPINVSVLRKPYQLIWPSCLLQNKCNVGYAFINMTYPGQIVPFYQVCFFIDP